MKDGLFKILENLDKVYEKSKWEKRKKRRKCENGKADDPNCELPIPMKGLNYTANWKIWLDN